MIRNINLEEAAALLEAAQEILKYADMKQGGTLGFSIRNMSYVIQDIEERNSKES